MNLSFYLDQAQRGTWWFDNEAEPSKTDLKARRQHLEMIVSKVSEYGRPVSLTELADTLDLSVYSLRNSIMPAVKAGRLVKSGEKGCVMIDVRRN